MIHAGCYSAALHYLKAVADMGVAAAKGSGTEVVHRMKAMPTDDDSFGQGSIRVDGRKLHPAYLFEVKSPAECKAPWDYYKLLQTTPPMRRGGRWPRAVARSCGPDRNTRESMMSLTRRSLLAASVGATMMPALPRLGRAQAANTIRIGVLNDQSGTYRDISGPYGVECTKQAVAEFGDKGFTVEVISADHQNKPDVGVNIARQWYDQGVDLILDVPTSSVGLAVNNVAREKNKAYINTGSATSDLTGSQCSPNTVAWMYDTYMLAKSTGGALVKSGGDSWFFITADYAFGHALERDTTNFVKAAGGKVMGSVRYPFPATTDFSSFLVQAQASRREDHRPGQCRRRYHQQHQAGGRIRHHRRGVKLAALLMFLPDVHALGLQTAQGLV